MQRLAGYCLTGSVREEVLIFFFGPGGNGKGTFIETLLYVMADYGVTIPMTTLVETRNPEHPTEIAKLCGARLAVASETKEGNYWDTGRIKALTGGDRLTGRFMRQDYFDFDPTHTLVVSSNARPSLAQVDDALRRRVQEVPFSQRFDNPDRTLKGRLRAEAEGILSWMVEGCLQWQEKGLDPPAEVVEASKENLVASDDLTRFMDDCCVRDLTTKTKSARFYQAWLKWCEARGRFAGSQRDFTKRMQEKWTEHESNAERGVLFLGLRVADDRDP
jgi:putative DNA primase/helicase